MGTPTEPNYEHTLSVNKDDLQYFANTEIGALLDDLNKNSGYNVMQRYAGMLDDTGNSLLVGNRLFFADSVVLDFKNLATGLATDLGTLKAQMRQAQVKIQLTLTIMDEAHEEAMTAAEMMEVLTKVSGAAPPKSGK
ncbi:hypothetical protein AB0D10_35320 [Kitasatospora sp. NPDC048545]|uniref:hypothetical protein n=1 Tax=Kitasatospora sp. NPDC048545 TaxID=3157208 RepID=UPI0033F5CF2D